MISKIFSIITAPIRFVVWLFWFPIKIAFESMFWIIEVVLTPFRYMLFILLYIPIRVLDFLLKIIAIPFNYFFYLLDKIFGIRF